MHRPGLSPDALKQWEGYYQQAVDSQRQGRFEAALACLMKAAELDSTHAEIRFRMAECLAALGQFEGARRHFAAARDCDALRFRADSRLNRIVREVAREYHDCTVALDIEDRLATASERGICGEELFLDHVHYNFHGNYLLAANMLPLIDSLIAAPVVAPRTVSEAECRERLAFTPWEELLIDQEVYSRLTKPPFTGQEDNLRRAALFKQEIARLSALAADSGQNIIAGYRRAVSLEPKDWWNYDLLGKYLLQMHGDPALAEQAFRKVLDTLPLNQFACNNLAIALERQGRTDEAIRYYREAIRIEPLFFDVYVNLADDLVNTSRIDEAEQCLKRVLRINPSLASARERYEQLLLMRRESASGGKTR
jgi:tetratricopeptide (TPR) repeat protein